MFREPTKDEIEVRVGGVYEKGITLLLYKDARCDMKILDETVGPFNWQRGHQEINGVVYCGVSIRDPQTNEWVWKWDAGAESYTEKEKGAASDSFKRACVNWGIGRSLYTSPFIWVNAKDVKMEGKKVQDKFKVRTIEFEDGVITHLTIENKRGVIVYSYGTPSKHNDN